MTSIRIAYLISFIERYALIVLSLLSNIILARILTPEEIGIYSVSLAVIGIAQVLREFGIGNFLIQEKNLTQPLVRTALGFSLLIGVSLFAITFFLAPFAGDFYAEARMVDTIRISSLNFLLLPFCTISLSLLKREMAFKKLLIVNLFASALGFGVTVFYAYSGYGANSMALGAVAISLVTGVGTWLVRSSREFLLPSFSEWKRLLRFCGQSLTGNLVTTIAADINDLALGKILGFELVAIISRAQGLMNLFYRDVMSAVRNVAFPSISKTFREGGDTEALHTFAIGAITAIAWPFYAFSSLFALELLRLLFGSQWDSAAALVPWFCLGGAVAAPASLVSSLLMAQGRIDLTTKADMIIQPLRALILVGGVAISRSIEIFAILYAVVFTLGSLFTWYMKSKCQKTNYRQIGNVLFKSVLVSIVCMLPPLVIFWQFSFRSTDAAIELMPLIFAMILCGSAWLSAIIFLGHPLVEDALFKNLIMKYRLRFLSLFSLLFGLVLLVIFVHYKFLLELYLILQAHVLT